MRCNLDNIPELKEKPHPFFLVPERKIELKPNAENHMKCSMRYREIGEGRPILLLHGLWTSAYTFRYLIEPLSSSYRLILPELIHFEENDRPSDLNYRPERLSGLFSSFGQALGLFKPLVVAHAESGLGALLLAMDHPQMLSALLTLDTCMQPPLGSRLRGRLMQGDWIRNRWARKGFSHPQQAACSMLDYADFSFVSRQEIRQLARHWASLPTARAVSTILAQSLSPAYRQTFIRRLSEHLSTGVGFSAPIKIVMRKSVSCLPRKIRDKLTAPTTNAELLQPPNGSKVVQVESPEWIYQIIASLASKYLALAS